MKKVRKLLLCLLPILLLSGCTKEGKLNEGECKGIISFTEIPVTYEKMDENLQKKVEILVRLKNITTEKEYKVELTKDNGYTKEISLHPGVYKVTSALALNSNYTGITVKADAETMEFLPDQEARLNILLKDGEAATNQWMDTQPTAEIRLADMYSGMIQINRKVISIKDIMSELTFSKEKTLNAYEKESFTDETHGITVTVQNKTDAPLFFDECEVISILATRNNVVFPEGVTIGFPASKLCHKTDGLYGEPNSFKGSALFGWGIDSTYAIYSDPKSGDRITICFDMAGEAIRSVQYEFAVFE